MKRVIAKTSPGKRTKRIKQTQSGLHTWSPLRAKSKAAFSTKTINPYELIDSIRMGLPIQNFIRVAKDLDLPKKQLAQYLHLAPRTLYMRRKNLNQDESEKVFRVQEVFRIATEVFGSETEAREWIKTPAFGLGDRCPIDLLDTDLGAQQVFALLSAIKWGNYF